MTEFIRLKKSEEDSMMNFMKGNDKRTIPCVGSFFVNPENKHLFLVDKLDYNKATQFQNGLEKGTRRTTDRRHPEIWSDSYQKGDYELTPRGRVFYDDLGDYFIIMTGKWIKDYPNIIQEVKDKFNLNGLDVRQGYNQHWDIGQGNFD